MFDTGKLTIYALTASAEDGGMPKEVLTKKLTCFYGERTVGYTRMYQARGADSQIDKLVRIPFDIDAVPNDYVVLEDGNQYRIDATSEVIVESSKRAKELTLVRLEELYDIA